MDNLSISEQRVLIEGTKSLLEQVMQVLPDTRGFEGVDPSWDYAWNELSGEAQDLVKATRKNMIEAIKACDDHLSE